MNARIIALLGLFVLSLAACAPDPRLQAQADQTRLQAEQSAANQTATRDQQQQQFDFNMQQQQAAAAQKQAAANRLIFWSSVMGSLAISVALIATMVGYSWAAIGTGRAAAQGATLRANLIQLNATTRQFPLVLQYVSRGKYSLTNMNTGQTVLLDTRNEGDRQMIAAAGATQIAGVIASEARKSTDPAGVSIINPPIIDAEDSSGLKVGRNIFEARDQILIGDDNE